MSAVFELMAGGAAAAHLRPEDSGESVYSLA